MYYNNMGHRDETWQDERFLGSLLAAVRWIDGKEEGDATPNPKVSAAHHQHSIKHSEAAGITVASIEAEKKAQQERAAQRRAAREAKKAAKKKAASSAE